MMRTHVYIDGFNLYYRALKGTPYKWLDLEALCHRLLPQNTILSIKYFTAHVNARPNDPEQPSRQQAYLRAITTSSLVEIILGHFLSSTIRMPLAHPLPNGAATVEVLKTEEKGSDVNIATHLLWDAVQDRYDVAVIISNDSDLLTPIKLVRNELGKKIVILTPSKHHQSIELQKTADYWKVLRQTHLGQSQFPNAIVTADGNTILKPSSW